MKPTLVISLDFELFWGVLESKTLERYGDHILGVHQAVPAMLDLFDHYDVKATFATVGFLFHPDSESLRQAWPDKRPEYKNRRLSGYEFPFEDGPYFFAPELVRQIQQRPQHEIATHTFSHYYCGVPGAEPDTFAADLRAALASGRKLGIDQTSIVFPRNQVQPDFVTVCRQVGLQCFRGNQTSWLYRTPERKLWGRLLRQLDSYLNLSGSNCQPWAEVPHPSGLSDVRASAMLRPHRPGQPWLDRLQRARIGKAMETAARSGSIYHLWWHPHNFGTHLEANLRNLESILKHYQRLAVQYQMTSSTMKEVAECSAR